MAEHESGVDYVSAPRDYAELFDIYYAYVVNLVHHLGIHESRKEDVASEILTRFLERDFLAKFDPTLVFTHEGKQHPARFKNFLSKFVASYVRGHYDKQQRLTSREVLYSGVDNDSSNSTPPDAWFDKLTREHPEIEDHLLDMVAEQELATGLRSYLHGIARRSPYDTCDLVALFDAVAEQIRDLGEVNIEKLKDKFQVSNTAMHNWMWWLRENLCEATGRPVPPKRRRTLKPKPPVA